MSSNSISWLREAIVVEDCKLFSRTLARELRLLGAREVHEIGTIAEAVGSIHESVDLVVSDVCLPDGDCRAVLKTVRARAPRARFVIMTGQAGAALCTQLAFGGAHRFLQKPFGRDELRETLEAIDFEALAAPRIDDLVFERGLKRAEKYLRSRARDEILNRTSGNVSQAARVLRVSRSSIYDLMNQSHKKAKPG
jgi:DNA-binding NtrC family response regulator